MEKLTREEKLKLCIKVERYYSRNKGEMGLCEAFSTLMCTSQSKVIPLIPELLKYKPVNKMVGEFWWRPSASVVRMKVLDKLIKEFSK